MSKDKLPPKSPEDLAKAISRNADRKLQDKAAPAKEPEGAE